MKKYQIKYFDETGQERKCELLGESEEDIRSQFKRFGYFKNCHLTFLFCPEDKNTMLQAISKVIRQQNFSLN